MPSTTPTPPEIIIARATLNEYDALVASDGWAGLSRFERSTWTTRLAEAVRLVLGVAAASPEDGAS